MTGQGLAINQNTNEFAVTGSYSSTLVLDSFTLPDNSSNSDYFLAYFSSNGTALWIVNAYSSTSNQVGISVSINDVGDVLVGRKNINQISLYSFLFFFAM